MLGFSKDADLEENKEAMTDELDTVISGQVTIAVRDTTIEGREIKKTIIWESSTETLS